MTVVEKKAYTTRLLNWEKGRAVNAPQGWLVSVASQPLPDGNCEGHAQGQRWGVNCVPGELGAEWRRRATHCVPGALGVEWKWRATHCVPGALGLESYACDSYPTQAAAEQACEVVLIRLGVLPLDPTSDPLRLYVGPHRLGGPPDGGHWRWAVLDRTDKTCASGDASVEATARQTGEAVVRALLATALEQAK